MVRGAELIPRKSEVRVLPPLPAETLHARARRPAVRHSRRRELQGGADLLDDRVGEAGYFLSIASGKQASDDKSKKANKTGSVETQFTTENID